MIDQVPWSYFDQAVRVRLGDEVGRIVSVGEALDWIRGEWPDVQARFRHAEALLRQAVETRTRDDVAAAREAFASALSFENLLVQ